MSNGRMPIDIPIIRLREMEQACGRRETVVVVCSLSVAYDGGQCMNRRTLISLQPMS